MIEYNLQIINGNQQIDTDFQYEYVIKIIIKRVDVAHFFLNYIFTILPPSLNRKLIFIEIIIDNLSTSTRSL